MRFNNILIIVLIVILIVIINFIMKTKRTKKTKKTTEYYGNVISETPYPELNKQMSMFNKIYEKNITPSIGLKNFIKNYY